MKWISPIFSSLSGKLGGAVGTTSRGGTKVLRSLIIPGNPRSIYQTTVRLIMTSMAAAWASTLTDLQRSVWESISPPNSSGIDSFVKGNMQRLLGALARVDDAPATLALTTTPVLTVAVDASAHTVTFTAVDALQAMNVYVSKPQNSSRLSQQFPETFAGKAAATVATITLAVTHPAYNLVAGDIVYVKLVKFGADATNAGQVATEQLFRVVVVA